NGKAAVNLHSLLAERERACDESVLADGNDPLLYAEGILKVCRAYLQSPLACVAGISGAGLKRRIETIMENRLVLRLNAARKCVLSAAAGLTLALPLALGLTVAPVPVQLQAIAAVLSQPLNSVEPAPSQAAAAPSAEVESVVSRPEPARVVPPRASIVAANIQPVVTLQAAALEPPSAAASDDQQQSSLCRNTRVYGRVVSSGVIQTPGFTCHLSGGAMNPIPITFGSCPHIENESDFADRMTTDTRLGNNAPRQSRSGGYASRSCVFDVTVNVQLADRADAAKMQPGTTVRLEGDFRVTTRNQVDYLSVTQAKVIWVNPFITPAASSSEPPVITNCHNNNVFGRVVSVGVVEMPGFLCDLGIGGAGPAGSKTFGPCPYMEGDPKFANRITTDTRLGSYAMDRARIGWPGSGSCTFDVRMNVRLADPADAGKMIPGTTVRLAGDFRVASRDRTDYLSVSNAKVIWVDPFTR
ncbi:MAG: hypothetical protein V4601_05520, partial [Pseudomonadota bacterium]